MRMSLAPVLATVIGLGFITAASAADLPVKALPAPVVAPFNWSGFYVGGHFGYIWGRTRVEEDGAVTEPHAKTDGVVGGVLVGYNWQNGPLVFGLEGDFGWSNARGTGGTAAPLVVVTELPNTYDLNWTSHVRGRVGYASGNWLFFAAGGVAIADIDFHEGGDITTIAQQKGGIYLGGSIGGGIDYAFTRNLIGRVEYLYDDFGHKNYIGADGDLYRVSFTGQTVRGALTWKFDPR